MMSHTLCTHFFRPVSSSPHFIFSIDEPVLCSLRLRHFGILYWHPAFLCMLPCSHLLCNKCTILDWWQCTLHAIPWEYKPSAFRTTIIVFLHSVKCQKYSLFLITVNHLYMGFYGSEWCIHQKHFIDFLGQWKVIWYFLCHGWYNLYSFFQVWDKMLL